MQDSPKSPVARIISMTLVGLVFGIPLYWVVISSLRTESEIFAYLTPINWETFFPTKITFENLIGVWQSRFGPAIFNSVFVAAMTVLLGLIVCSLAAFALAVLPFKGRGVLFAVIIVSFLIPFDAIALPLYNIMLGMGLQNTYAGIILPGIGNGLAVFLLRQFFLGIPKELHEAGRIDGLSWFAIFWKIYLPLSRPALIGAALVLFIAQWQAYLWPLIIAPAQHLKVAAVAIAEFATSFQVSFGMIFAASLYVSLIPMVTLLIFQRYFTASVAATGGKE